MSIRTINYRSKYFYGYVARIGPTDIAALAFGSSLENNNMADGSTLRTTIEFGS
jgi:hypothetical protein